jgi:para-aminobenzoate synthetase
LKTLLIDNYDSFTFNLFQYLAEINGEPPLVVRNDELSWAEAALLPVDNIVISPGPGRPERPEDFGICRQAILESPLPILGICLGHQGIGHLFGGRVRSAPPVMHGRLSEIVHTGEALFRGLPSPFTAVRYHSLVVDPELPEALRSLAWTRDGVLMGLAHRTRPIWGVQFHPESICSEHGRALLRNFRDLSPPRRLALKARPQARSCLTPPRRRTLHHRRIACFPDPEAVFQRCFAASEGAYFLHSAELRAGTGRFSFMGDSMGPASYIVSYRSAGRRLTITRPGSQQHLTESIFDFLARELTEHRCEDAGLPFEFAGGFVGYFGYELKQECGSKGPHHSSQPDAMFIFADRFVAFDHVAREIHLVAVTEHGAPPPQSWLDAMEEQLAAAGTAAAPEHGVQETPVVFHLQQDRATYLARIAEALGQIEAGESYEVCLTNKLILRNAQVDAFSLYRTLKEINPAPFAAFLKLPGLTILSSSPERFLHVDRSARVEAKPIKGTVRRAPDAREDARLARELAGDEKSRAENLMIVDLLRNDLGRVCEVGSIAVPKLMDVESYATVHQLVSTIEGRLARGRSVIDLVRAAFPGGSMTGAPKLRTLEIIDRLEGAARGVYSGSLGYLSLNGAADLNIVIRTIVATDNQLSIGVGGAIVALSDPETEFEETMLKAQALIDAIVIAQRGSLKGAACVIEGLAPSAPERPERAVTSAGA